MKAIRVSTTVSVGMLVTDENDETTFVPSHEATKTARITGGSPREAIREVERSAGEAAIKAMKHIFSTSDEIWPKEP